MTTKQQQQIQGRLHEGWITLSAGKMDEWMNETEKMGVNEWKEKKTFINDYCNIFPSHVLHIGLDWTKAVLSQGQLNGYNFVRIGKQNTLS